MVLRRFILKNVSHFYLVLRSDFIFLYMYVYHTYTSVHRGPGIGVTGGYEP